MPYQILIAEDDPDVRAVVADILESFEQTVEVCADGAAAWDAIERNPSAIDLVIADIGMPKLNGMQLLEKINTAGYQLPVAILTGSRQQQHMIAALRLSAFDFLIKPFSPQHVQAMLERLDVIQQRESGPLYQRFAGYQEQIRIQLPTSLQAVSAAISPITCQVLPHLRAHRIDIWRLKTCLVESLMNATVHGNLELSSELRERDWDQYQAKLDQHLQDPRLSSRTTQICLSLGTGGIELSIEDQGSGFDFAGCTKSVDALTLENSGRGLVMIQHLADEVEWTPPGNKIRMTFQSTS